VQTSCPPSDARPRKKSARARIFFSDGDPRRETPLAFSPAKKTAQVAGVDGSAKKKESLGVHYVPSKKKSALLKTCRKRKKKNLAPSSPTPLLFLFAS
jgi:hypothetical protein